MPKISIITPSFNHERFVKEHIQSILSQSFKDFELILIDDYSSDKNVEEILTFKTTKDKDIIDSDNNVVLRLNSHITLIRHAYNKGINAALNTGFTYAKGEYIVFCASDDTLAQNALEILYKHISTGKYIAIYSILQAIDANSNATGRKLKSLNLDRYGHLRYIFCEQNSLVSPGLCITKEAIAYLYPLPHEILSLQDLYMHVKLLMHGDILLLENVLVGYREEHGGNISKRSEATDIREKIEYQKILDLFLDIKDIAFFKRIFSKEIERLGLRVESHNLDFCLAKIALNSPKTTPTFQVQRIWGYNKMMDIVSNRYTWLYEQENFTFKDFVLLANECVDDRANKRQRKYKRYKIGFNISLAIIAILAISLIFTIMAK